MKSFLQRIFLLFLTIAALNLADAQGQCDTLTNFTGAYTPAIIPVPSPGWGYVSGHNNFGHTAKAEYFDYNGSSTHLKGALFAFGYAFTVNPLSKIVATVWDGTGGQPGAVLAQKDVLITQVISAIFSFQPLSVDFGTPVPLPASDEFFVGFTMTTGTDTVAVVTSSPFNVPMGQGTAWQRLSNGIWQNYNSPLAWGLDATHLILPILVTPVTADFTPTNISGCTGSTVAFDASNSVGATTYLWQFPGGTPATSTSPNPSVVYNTAGNYNVTLLVSNGCQFDTLTRTQIISITNCAPTCNLSATIAGTSPSCNGLSDGTASVNITGGTAPFTYQWSTTPAQTTAMASNLSAGAYSVTITDANSCSIVGNFTLTQPLPLLVNTAVTAPTVCNGTNGTATAIPSGGTMPYTYAWNTTPAQTNATATGLGQGNYTVTVTDANGCVSVGGASVSDGCASCTLTLNVSKTNASCGQNNGTATANVTGQSGNVFYFWSNNGTTPTISNLGIGTYSVTVADAVGCVDSGFVHIVQTGVVTVNLIPSDNFCSANGAAVSAVAGGGAAPYSYQWNNGSTSPSISNVASGSYSVTVSDANGCAANSTIAVTSINNAPTLHTTQTNVTCFGANDGLVNMTISGGNLPFAVFWAPLNISAINLNGLAAGAYTAVVVDQAGCLATTSVIISQPDSITLLTTSTPTTGTDGTATVNAVGGTPPFTFLWNNGETSQTITGLSDGTYSVTVTDANGCSNDAAVLVQEFTTQTNEIQSLSKFDLLPNPTNGYFTINLDFSEKTDFQLAIFNLLGQPVFQFNAAETTLNLPLELPASGAYFVVVQTEKGKAVKRLMVTK